MLNRYSKKDSTPLINFCFRVTPAMKAALLRRAAERSQSEGAPINAGQIVREMVAKALAAKPDVAPLSLEERLFEELLLAAFFARKSLAVLLQKHEGLAEDLVKQSRAELERRKRGGK